MFAVWPTACDGWPAAEREERRFRTGAKDMLNGNAGEIKRIHKRTHGGPYEAEQCSTGAGHPNGENGQIGEIFFTAAQHGALYVLLFP